MLGDHFDEQEVVIVQVSQRDLRCSHALLNTLKTNHTLVTFLPEDNLQEMEAIAGRKNIRDCDFNMPVDRVVIGIATANPPEHHRYSRSDLPIAAQPLFPGPLLAGQDKSSALEGGRHAFTYGRVAFIMFDPRVLHRKDGKYANIRRQSEAAEHPIDQIYQLRAQNGFTIEGHVLWIYDQNDRAKSYSLNMTIDLDTHAKLSAQGPRAPTITRQIKAVAATIQTYVRAMMYYEQGELLPHAGPDQRRFISALVGAQKEIAQGWEKWPMPRKLPFPYTVAGVCFFLKGVAISEYLDLVLQRTAAYVVRKLTHLAATDEAFGNDVLTFAGQRSQQGRHQEHLQINLEAIRTSTFDTESWQEARYQLEDLDCALSTYDVSALKILPIGATIARNTMPRFEHLTIIRSSEGDGPISSQGSGATQTVSVPLSDDERPIGLVYPRGIIATPSAYRKRARSIAAETRPRGPQTWIGLNAAHRETFFTKRPHSGDLLSWTHKGRVREEYRGTQAVIAHTIETLASATLPHFRQGHAGKPFPAGQEFDKPAPPSPDRVEFTRRISLGKWDAPEPHEPFAEASIKGDPADPEHVETVDPPHSAVEESHARGDGFTRLSGSNDPQIHEQRCAFVGPGSNAEADIRAVSKRQEKKWRPYAEGCMDNASRTPRAPTTRSYEETGMADIEP